MKRKVLCDLFEFTPKTLYNWRQERRPVIELIEKYFTEEDLKEFLNTQKMKKLENVELYAQYESKIMDEIRNVISSANNDIDPLYVYQFIDEIGKKYASLQEQYIKTQEKEKFTASSYCEPYEYNFTDILEEEIDKSRNLFRLKMIPITVEKFIKKNIYNIDDLDSYFIPNLYPEIPYSREKIIFYVQYAIFELYKNELLSFAFAHIETLIKESRK